MLSTADMQFEVADRNTATCYGGFGLAQIDEMKSQKLLLNRERYLFYITND
ncbi:MAG: hypothetical protein ABGZ53_17720 [Fuerstiella sp.]